MRNKAEASASICRVATANIRSKPFPPETGVNFDEIQSTCAASTEVRAKLGDIGGALLTDPSAPNDDAVQKDLAITGKTERQHCEDVIAMSILRYNPLQ